MMTGLAAGVGVWTPRRRSGQEGFGRNCPDAVLPQALRSRLGQPGSVENLAKALAGPLLQDFLRTMSTGRCTWNHLLLEKSFAILVHHETKFKNFFTIPGGAPPGAPVPEGSPHARFKPLETVVPVTIAPFRMAVSQI